MNVLIDFACCGQLQALLGLPYRWMLPDLTLAELRDPNPNLLRKLGVIEINFTSLEIGVIFQLRSQYRGLSLADCGALFLAQRQRGLLLTGDRLLRRIASEAFNLTVHGTLWALDELVAGQHLTPSHAAAALKQMLAHQRRLPQPECKQRLRRWE
ncbi:MAG: hypothetical protein NZL92_11320 [Gloeomargarita sp. SKYG116]|nr:hypothetical protein [Gloeomargarita sp. SKYG116]MCS7226693.1 hypothetical protein [Gloeomargarita sp. SKYB31]MDW8402272.1 hypothetical protein [Gloeomargarita sp. SKYGB_i_bin116]